MSKSPEDRSFRKPAIGDVVIYKGPDAAGKACEAEAWITKVWSDECVNLKVAPYGRPVFHVCSELRADVADDLPSSWSWPPRV